MKKSCITIDFNDIGNFISTFYPQRGDRAAWYSNSPRLLVILWGQKKIEAQNSNLLVDLKPLLKLRSWSLSTAIHFAGRSVVEDHVIHARCYYCGHCMCGNCGRLRDPEARPGDYICDDPECIEFLDGCEGFHDDQEDSDPACDHEDIWDEQYNRRAASFEYLDVVNDFLGNNNARWLHLIREDFQHQVSVQCALGSTTTVYIHFATYTPPAILNTKDMYWSSCDFLTQMGIMDLATRKNFDFILSLPTRKPARSVQGFPLLPSLYQTLISGSEQSLYRRLGRS